VPGWGPRTLIYSIPYDGYAPMTQFFLEAFQWHGVKRGDAFAFYAGDIKSRDRTRCARAGGRQSGERRTRRRCTPTASSTPRHGWRTAGHGSGRDCAGGIHHAEQWGVDHVRETPELRGCGAEAQAGSASVSNPARVASASPLAGQDTLSVHPGTMLKSLESLMIQSDRPIRGTQM